MNFKSCEIIAPYDYQVTGTFKGRRYYYSHYDYELVLKIFTVNNFTSLWQLDKKTGKRKLLKRGEKQ